MYLVTRKIVALKKLMAIHALPSLRGSIARDLA